MQNWMLEAAQMAIAGLVMAYILYTLMFSSREERRREHSEQQRRGFERRGLERADRRRANLGPPDGLKERRMVSRRS